MIEIIVEQDKVKTVGGVWQYDIGEKLRITGIDLTGCQMQWDYASLPQGTDNRPFEPLEGNTDLTLGGECAIPDQALTVLGEVNGYIYYTDGTPKCETLAVVRIELKERPRPTDYVSNDNIATLEMLIDNRINGMKFVVASEDELPENPVDGAEAIVREASRIGTVVSGTVERIYINDDFIPTGDHWAEFELLQTSRVRHLVSAKIADKLVEPVEGVPAVVVPLPSLVEAVIYVKVYADISSAFYGELKAGWNRVVFDPETFAHIDTFSAVFGELPLLADCTIITESNTRGFLSSHPWQEKPLTHYYAINGKWYKIGSEAIEYADLDAPYAGYPFRVGVQDAFYEFGQYDTPENISVKKGDCPLPSSVFPEGVHRSEAGFINEETGKSITIGVYDGTEADTPLELDIPYALLHVFATVQTSLYLNNFEQMEVDDGVLEPGCYLLADDGSPTAIDKSAIPEFKNYRLVHDSWWVVNEAEQPLNPQFLGYYFNNAVPNVYYWNGAEYVEVGGADLSAYATKEYVDENAGVTVNEVAPINGNITLDTSNIEPIGDRWYLTGADVGVLYALRGDNDGADFPDASFILSGSANEITSDNSAIVAGGFNSVDGWYSATIGGADNLVSANCSATIGGEGLIASASHSAIVGRHGETPADSRFAVANGTDENNKKIVFYVGGDGVSHFDEMPVVPAGRVINADNQLVDKKYVDENAGSTSLTELTGSVLSVGNFYKTVSETISFTLPTADTSKSNLIMLDLEVVGNISIGFGTTYAANMSVPLMVAGNYLVSWEYSNIVSDWVVTVLPYGVIV